MLHFCFSITLLGGRSLYSGNNIQVQEVIMEGSGELGDEWEGSKGQESFKTEDLL